MEASPTKVIQYFDGQKQNLIPLFQRRYTWELDNWKSLWDDLMVQYELGESGTHFMGAIVSVPALAVPVGVSKFLIIDGQQRLTTVSLILCALRDCLDDPSAALIQGVYLTNPFRELEDTLKFVPTQGDREVYREIALDRQIPSKDSLMGKAYHFFKDRILNGLDSNDEPVLPAKVLTTLQQCLQVVMINLGNDDDPYLIFESLNFKGEPLTQADLVRNYVLMRFRHSIGSGGEQKRIYEDYWEKIEKSLGDNLTEFLRHYTMKDGDDIKQGGIYAAIKKKLKSIDTPEAVEAEVHSIKRFSEFYAAILCPQQEPNKAVQDRLNNIQSLKVTTSYPLLLRFFDDRKNNKLSDIDLEKCLGLIESYIVRRTVCGVPTNTLNKLFIQWAKNFPSASHVQWLHDVMSSGSGGRRFPRDVEFTEAFLKQPQYGRSTTRFILCRLEKSFNNKEMIDLTNAGVTIEHVLPQKLSPEWQQELGAEAEEIHAALLHTFGNLTLTAYNSELSNLPFTDKKDELKRSHIDLNQWVLEQANWRAAEIEERAKSLLIRALKIWSASLS
ncbi:hypothetical protein APA_3416 [Pseudanabaena sp. lw0831]|uniref:DUF262 domain-containing protein n=1 Tax=Pseudanabaena sp. lw0831 TaxID=1357935 RepID=UPI00191641CE|nr:DUF262 domain-containing protein [Pseudanabaena sp. lw0831]GBO55366.1 hypothetical protein APA_3416 [Pseudanabaena sp. lw0831]